VNSLFDEIDGSIIDGDVSLRDAINLAAANDTINFSITGTINLTLGELTIARPLTINGPGANLLTIDASGNDPTPNVNDGNGSRVFDIDDGDFSPEFTAHLSGMTITGGDTSPEVGPFSAEGGGIRTWEHLNIANCTVTGNYALVTGGGVSVAGNLTMTGCTISGNTSAGGGGGIRVSSDFGGATITNSTISSNIAGTDGGGIRARVADTVTVTNSTISGNSAGDDGGGIDNRNGGDLTVINSTISDNTAGSYGGGIANREGQLTVTGSTISGNTASFGGGILGRDGVTISINGSTISNNQAPNSNGGGIEVFFATLNISNSTISGNVTASGGGILSYYSTTTIVSSTISGNRATSIGGGILKYYGTLNVFHSTITGNHANSQGGGIQSLGLATGLDHTIVADNTMGVGFVSDQDVFGAAAARFSLIGNNFGATITNNGGNLIGTPTSQVDPMLETLANNGGLTWTHALKPGSPALEAGDPAAVAGIGNVPLRDQRGAPFVRVFDNDGVGGARIDIGAFERQTLPAGQSLVVDTLVDENDLNYGPGDLSLREAIALANGSAGSNTITFAPSLANGTILLTQGELMIVDEVTINGPLTQFLTIDASGNDPTPILNNGDGSRVFNIDNGNVTADFTVTLSNLTITGGDQGGGEFGGGIGSLEHLALTNCIVFNNSATGRGGGVYADGNLTVNNCLISNNHTGNDGGGIRASGDGVTILGSQISANSADGDGGGIRVGAATIVISGSTISGNTAGGDGGGIRSAAADGTVTVTGSTISGNSAVGFGGGIDDRSSGDVTVTGSTISGNTGANGGGIANHDGLLSVNSSTISGNAASSQGGGIYNTNGQLTVTASTVIGNTGGFGGGMLGRYGSMDIIRSTISGNNAPNSNGGGIEAVFTTLNVSNSTVSGNTAGVGGGVFSYASTTTISNSTITANNGIFVGGGVAVTNGGSMTLTSTIVAGNLRGATRDDISGTVTANYTLVGDNSGATINTTEGGNLVGTSGAPINPLLGPLADNLGPTKTHKLLNGSPAIDTGRPGFMPGPSFDQRGTPFVRVFDGDSVGGARIDIGAYELQPDPPAARGDFSGDGVTDAADYVVWVKLIGTNVPPYSGADANGNGIIDQGDFFVFQKHFGETAPPFPGSGAGGQQEVSRESESSASMTAETAVVGLEMQDDSQTAKQPRIAGIGFTSVSSALPQIGASFQSIVKRTEPKLARVTKIQPLRRDHVLLEWAKSHMAEERLPETGNELGATQNGSAGERSAALLKALDVAFDELSTDM
jgi:predicted outer membrane repeat protein